MIGRKRRGRAARGVKREREGMGRDLIRKMEDQREGGSENRLA